MAIGSFLASAGRIGEGIERYQTESELRRLQQQQAALTRGELARQEQFRQLQLEAPTVEVPEQGLLLGAPMQVTEPEFNLAGLSTAAAPAAAPAPTAGVATGAAPAPTAGAAPAAPKPVKLGGVTIPGFDSRKPVRLNDGVAGFKKLDPNASDVTRSLIKNDNTDRLNRYLYGLAMKASDVTTIFKPFVKQDKKRSLEMSDAASNYYRSDVAREYFSRNPEMLAVAQKNPVEFFQKVGAANLQAAEVERARRAGVATPAATAAVEPTAGVRSSAPPGQAAAVTAKAKRYDTQGTQYDAIVQQAAARYGVDATILKRLIASESSFNPNIVNTESGALGLAQIMPDHIRKGLITDAQARDPAIAINFAAAHLAQNLRNERGDYRNALLRYKGALSQKGITSMAPVVRDITSGFQWDAQQVLAAVGPQLAKSRDPATNASLALRAKASAGGAVPSGVQVASVQDTPVPVRIDPSNFYLANPNATSRDTRMALQNRQELARMADMYRRAGMGNEFTAARLKLIELDNSLVYLQGMQGLQELALANDPRRLAAVWSDYAGVPVQLQPQTDGSFNILVNGRVTQRGVARSSIIDQARSSFDKQYVQTQSAAAAEQATEYFKSQLRMTEEAAKASAKFAADIQLKLLEGQNAQALEIVKQMDPNGKLTVNSDGSGQAFLQVQGQTLLIDKGGVQIEGAREGLLSGPSAKTIGNLPQRSAGIGTGG